MLSVFPKCLYVSKSWTTYTFNVSAIFLIKDMYTGSITDSGMAILKSDPWSVVLYSLIHIQIYLWFPGHFMLNCLKKTMKFLSNNKGFPCIFSHFSLHGSVTVQQ